MPLYEYRCGKCGEVQTAYRAVDDRDDLPECCGAVRRIISLPHVVEDMKPYQTVAADPETGKRVRIGSRREHRNFLAKTGFEEMGNEPPKKPATNERKEHERIAREIQPFFNT